MNADIRQIFAVGATVYTVRDIVDAAAFRGELEPVWTELLRRLACENRADEEGRETDEDVVDAVVQEFRYDHDLITAEETEQWLVDRDLTLSDFSAFFTRQYWGNEMSDVKGEPVPLLSAPPELRDSLHGELVLTGEMAGMANRLARRLAVGQNATGTLAPAMVAGARAAFLERSGLGDGEVTRWLAEVGRDEAWLMEMLRLEAIYQDQREHVLTREAFKRELQSLRFELTVFDLEIIEFDSLDAAREALLCVREDGMSMEDVALEGRYPFHRKKLLLEDIPPETQQQFLSVIPGRVLEPMEVDGEYRLCRVLSKNEPDPEDKGVQRRVEQRVMNRHFADAVAAHVHWHLSL